MSDNFQPTHRHRCGRLYQIMGYGTLQTSEPLSDMDRVVMYRDEGGAWWLRPQGEFQDGRFTELKNKRPPMSDEQEMRAAFEAWFKSKMGEAPRQGACGIGYTREYPDTCWEGFQAAWNHRAPIATEEQSFATGAEYWKQAIGGAHTSASKKNKYALTYPATVNEAYRQALSVSPLAADVIAALVFFKTLDQEREELLKADGWRWMNTESPITVTDEMVERGDAAATDTLKWHVPGPEKIAIVRAILTAALNPDGAGDVS